MLSGRNEIMKLVGDGIVYHGGSFNSNVASIAAASASLDVMINDNNFYEDLDNKGKKLMGGIEKLSHELDSNIHVQGLGSVFSISFTNKKNIKDWREHFNYCDENKYKVFCELMFNKGIRLSSNGRVHLSTAHTSEDIDLTLEAIKSTLLKLKER